MVPNFILTVNERSVRQKPIVGRSLKFNTTLLQITIIAKALSIELSEEHIADLLQEAVTDQRDEYRQLRKLYAEYRIGWAEILSKLGVKKWPSAPLENPDGVDEISNAYLQSRLGADNYRMFATGGEQFNEALDQLLTAVRIETDLSFHEESAPNQMQNAFEEKMMNFFQTQREHNRQVLTDEVINLHYPLRPENILTISDRSKACSLGFAGH